jgi:hypothetical protein
MIILDDTLLIGRGQVRSCYHHPEDERLVIKVPSGPQKAQVQANHKEIKGYRFLLQRHGWLDCISHCHGFAATSRGEGLVCDCIRDSDGTISPTIWDIIHSQNKCDLNKILAIVEQFCAYLAEKDIWLFDLNLKNIALSRQSDNTCRAIVLDLKGRYDNNEFIPFSSYIGFLARRKRQRRARQLLERISYFYAARHKFYPIARFLLLPIFNSTVLIC